MFYQRQPDLKIIHQEIGGFLKIDDRKNVILGILFVFIPRNTSAILCKAFPGVLETVPILYQLELGKVCKIHGS